jgi:hypothetical protein
MLQPYVSSVSEVCCKCFYIGVAEVAWDGAKVDRDVTHVAMAIRVCFKCMF